MAVAADELILLERVFLRIGSAETDEQLQNAVQKFLPPVLLKLSSTQEGVRKKVMELLVHINKRIKSRPLIQLPVEALLVQYQDPSASSFVTNFTIIYLKLGFPRLSIEKQVELIPSLLNSLEGKPQSHQDSLLLLVVPLLGHVVVPNDPAKRSSWFAPYEKPIVGKQLSTLVLDMLLLPYGATSQVPPADTSGQASTSSEVSFPIPPGMSEYSFKRITVGNPLKAEELEQIKLGIVKFLSHGFLPDCAILPHLIVAAADTRFSVANSADMELKKIVGGLDWSSRNLVMPLYMIFLGTQTTGSTLKPEMRKTPASTRIKLKILPYLCRATGSALKILPCTQIIFDSLFGNSTNARLKSLALNFTSNLIKEASVEELQRDFAQLLLTGLKKFIKDAEVGHQAQTYIIIGNLVRRLPHLFSNNIMYLQDFVQKLMSASAELRQSMGDALLLMASVFKMNDEELTNEIIDLKNVEKLLDDPEKVKMISKEVHLIALISHCLQAEEASVRFVAVMYAITIFPTDHICSRYLLLLASGDSYDQITAEALKSLYGSARKFDLDLDTEVDSKNSNVINGVNTATKNKFPNFTKMCMFISKEANLRKLDDRRYEQGSHVLPYNIPTYITIISYLRLCLAQEAGIHLSRKNPQNPTQYTPLITNYLCKLFESTNDSDSHPVMLYLNLIEELLSASVSIAPISCFAEIIGCIPEILTNRYLDKLSWFRNFLNATNEEIRENGSLIYGVITAHILNDSKFDEAMAELISATKNSKLLETQHGTLLALAHGLERKITIKKMNGDSHTVAIWSTYKTGVETIVSFLNNSNALLISAACASVGLLGRCFNLPLENGSENESEDKVTKLSVIKSLFSIMNNVKFQSKIRERAAQSIGLICVGEIFPHTRFIIQGFINTAKETKDIEVHFSIGESLVMCIQSIWSNEGRDPWTTLPKDYSPQNVVMKSPPDDDFNWLLEELLKLIEQPHPNSRQATCIWLLALLKNCYDRQPIKSHMIDIQNAFKDLLSENNDIVQDVASKGLGLIYEYCDENMRKEMLDSLIDQLQSGRRTVAQVTDETKLFEEGQLGKAPTGGNLSTYKELCSLASDLNKPDLIYKFMHLANHNAIWNSKKGAAFGFSTIAKNAGEQITPHFPKIIPRLYRYRFDPTPSIQSSMERIWTELVTEKQKTLDLYQKEILEDLITNLTAGQWRVRMSCCLALQDFLQGGGNRSIHDCVDAMPQIWSQLFRVMDDVHEGTRNAAGKTTKMLGKLCVRACDVSQGKNGTNMLNAILPVLLNAEILHTVPEIRSVSLQTISQLVGSAGVLLKPHLSVLIPALLQATGELENSKLSYLSTMYGAQNQVQDEIDSFRASAALSHFTTETVGKCLQYIDSTVMDEMTPKVAELIKNTGGLGTKVATAHFITLLTVQMGKSLNPYTGKLLSASVSGLSDRNSAVRKYNALAIGHLVGSANDSSIQKLFEKLHNWYFKSDKAETIRSAIAQTIQAVANKNQEIVKSYSNILMPLIFFAMHEEKTPENQTVVELWNDIWSENSPGTETGIRQNLKEICEILQTSLESSEWIMKAQGANAVSTVATKLKGSMDSKYRNMLIHILVNGLSGRTWNGKEKLMKAIASICSNCKEEIKNDADIDTSNIVNTMMKECRKDEIVYKRNCLEATGDVVSALEIDRFEELYNIAQSTFKVNIEKDEDATAEEMSKKRENRIKLDEVMYETLGKAWPNNSATQDLYCIPLVEHCVKCLPSTVRTVQVCILTALNQFVEKLLLLQKNEKELTQSDKNTLSTILENICTALSISLSISKYARLRTESLNIVITLLKKLKVLHLETEIKRIHDLIKSVSNEIENDTQPEIKTRMNTIKELMKD